MKVGILGGGQLARMLVLASSKLPCEVKVYTSPGNHCVEGLCSITQKNFTDVSALKEFISSCDVVTYEWENIPMVHLKAALEGFSNKLFPQSGTLEMIADRFSQKSFFRRHLLPTAEFVLIQSQKELEQSIQNVGTPGILKTTREGYDGKGQKVVREFQDCGGAWSELGSVPLIYERFVKFDRELSLVACRNARGEMSFYPLVENLHINGILRRTLAPAPSVSQELEETARNYAKQIGELLDYVGVMALELFQCGDSLLINEMASRVHNTGHWTIDGAVTSQFENHLRAGLGMPLGKTQLKSPTAMLNFIGEVPELKDLQEKMTGLFVYDYGKEPKPNRKVGHSNVVADSFLELSQKLQKLEPRVCFSFLRAQNNRSSPTATPEQGGSRFNAPAKRCGKG